jgi:prolyl oligopeptidase
MKCLTLALAIIAITLLSCNNKKEQTAIMKYPETVKVDTVDNYFGEPVADPYRCL